MTTGHWPVANKQSLLFFKRNLGLTMFIKHCIIDISRTFFLFKLSVLVLLVYRYFAFKKVLTFFFIFNGSPKVHV